MKTKENNLNVFDKQWIFYMIVFLVFILMCWSIYPSSYVLNNSNVRAPLPLRRNNKTTKSDSDEDVMKNSWMMEMEEKYLKENKRIKKVCKRFGHKPNDKRTGWFNSLWTDTRHKIVACLNAKVGSSTWKSNFYNLLPEDKRKMLEKKYGPPYYRSAIISKILFKVVLHLMFTLLLCK